MYIPKYDETIVINKPTIQAKNVIFGGMYIDAFGQIQVYNSKTQQTGYMNYIPQKSQKDKSRVEGKIFDS